MAQGFWQTIKTFAGKNKQMLWDVIWKFKIFGWQHGLHIGDDPVLQAKQIYSTKGEHIAHC